MQLQKLIKKVTQIVIIVIILVLVFCVKHKNGDFSPIIPIQPSDTIPPVILLVEGLVRLNLGEIFKDPGYIVIDDPGITDITEKLNKIVKDGKGTIKDSNTFYLQEGEYLIYYNVADSSGNKAVEKVRKVIVGPDIEKPKMKLLGPEKYTLFVNQPFVDPGVEAIDNVDKAITDKIKIEGDKVDVSKPGEYKIKYTVSDNAGNTAERYRTVIIKANKNTPKAEAGQDKTVGINDPINLTGIGIDIDGSIVKYEWKFGRSGWVVTSAGDTTITAPSTAQTYVCSLRVTDDDELTASDNVIITVISSAPTVEVGSDTTVGINEPVNLHGKGFDTDGSIVKYEWKFGRGGWVVTSAGDTTITAPSTAQTYVCSLRVTDNDGLTAVEGIVLTISLTVQDIDGNVYHTVKIGNQIWTVENLRTTKYNDGTKIFQVISDSDWVVNSPDTGICCYYHNITSPLRVAKIGLLYNWHVVNTGKIAPAGWHVPTNAEWDELMEYLITNGHNWDGTTEGNKIAKSMASKSYWTTSKVEGGVGFDNATNNSSGFSALPGGYRHGISGKFKGGDWAARWWTATESYDKSGVYSSSIFREQIPLVRQKLEKTHAFSIRLVKD